LDAGDAIAGTITSLVAAWNSGDVSAFGAFFTENARYTGTDGILREGRSRIEAMLREYGPGRRVSVHGPISVDRTDQGASAQFHWTETSTKQGRGGSIDCMLVLTPDGWCIDALVNRSAPSL
jgi:uncharacterized protein (TIGR02246 family)